MSEITWIPLQVTGRLGMMPKPLGALKLATEIQFLKESGVDVLVSLLEHHEASRLGLAAEQKLCSENQIQFHLLSIPDYGIPDSNQMFSELVEIVADRLFSGGSVVVHCHRGVGRSSLLVAAVATREGQSLDNALALITQWRRKSVSETRAQREWLESFVETRADRNES